MNDPTKWAGFVAALEPYGWSEYVHDNGYRSGAILRHAESGAWARVTIKRAPDGGDILVTEGYPNDRSTKVRRFRDGTNDWPTTAKVWAEKIGADKITAKVGAEVQRRLKLEESARMRALADSMCAHMARTNASARPWVQRSDESSATVAPFWPGQVYGDVRIYGPDEVRVYLADVGGDDLAGIVAMVDAVRRWRDSYADEHGGEVTDS